MIYIKQPHLTADLEIWAPKYSGESGWRVLVKVKKVYDSPGGVIRIHFTKAKHLMQGQRFAMRKSDMQKYPIVSNGKIDCFSIPIDDFEPWECPADIINTIKEIGWM